MMKKNTVHYSLLRNTTCAVTTKKWEWWTAVILKICIKICCDDRCQHSNILKISVCGECFTKVEKCTSAGNRCLTQNTFLKETSENKINCTWGKSVFAKNKPK